MGALNRNSKSASKQASSADQNTFCIDCFFKSPKVIILNQLISLNLEVGLYLGVGALIWDYDKKTFKQLLTYSRADLTRFCIYWFFIKPQNVIFIS